MKTRAVFYAGPLDYIGHYLAGQEPPDPRTDTSDWAVLNLELYTEQPPLPQNLVWFVQMVEKAMDRAARDAMAQVCTTIGVPPIPDDVFAQWRPLWRDAALAVISDSWKDAQ